MASFLVEGGPMFHLRSVVFAMLGELRTSVGRVALAVAGVLGCVGVLAPAAGAATAVSCGSTISAPGKYFLAANCSGPGIAINASNVTLKLKGHTMTGPGTGDIGVAGVETFHTTRVNILGPGTITNYGFGVALDQGVTHSTVGGITANNNAAAIFIATVGTNDNTIRNNTADHNANSGMVIDGSGTSIHGNTVNNNSGEGFDVEGDGNAIRGNIADNNGDNGIVVNANSNTLNGNTTDNNSSDGIFVNGPNPPLPGATNNTIRGNTALGNSSDDLFDGNPGCDSNRWNGNTFNTANQPCIH